ncbi:hypothetical protein PUR61_44985 [Streptomyces sp. BE20]|uniref:hypothetical protein n=1 Tax=Streptomyces sp. BE20 TaxID=3002525 RepID=UPI002E78A691|nr:hypothetical protein [Streptomyces sp. BE20]MEE1829273.1 hypothetical protein [Streptomyces sp. BE20]
MWAELGFRQSPYATDPVPANEEGESLFVGRGKVAEKLTRRLTSTRKHPTIEGENGVGKTSLVSIVGYRLYQDFKQGRTSCALIPLPKPFQLSAEDKAESLERRVLLSVASELVKRHDELKQGGVDVPNISNLEKWLTFPTITSGGGGGSVLGFGATATRGTAANTSSGFSEAGFKQIVDDYLRQCFPAPESGGFICVLDNLELLETSQAARTQLESIRDGILAQHGLRWVLCGARGIVRTSASSPRMEGRLAEPLDLLPIDDGSISEVIQRRIQAYQIEGADVKVPVGPESFRKLYDILNRNLRNALAYSEDFSLWVYEEEGAELSSERFAVVFDEWVRATAARHNDDTSLGGRAWEVFDRLAGNGGSCSPGDFSEFDFESSQAMRPHVKNLEEANLVISSASEEDKRRKTISLTPRGWLVRYARSGFELPAASTA